MKNKFLQISIGVSIMLLSAGFLVRSIGSANASAPATRVMSSGGWDEYPVGVSNGTAYWIEHDVDGGKWYFHSKGLADFKD